MRFAASGISVVAIAMLLLLALAPHAAFGLSGQECVCSDALTGNVCGQEGFVCHCCESEAQLKLSGVPLIKDCHNAIKSFSIINPPALISLAGGLLIDTPVGSLALQEPPLIHDEFVSPPLRPPRILHV